MHDGIRMIIERLSGDVASVAVRELDWKRLVDRVLHDEVGIYSEEEKTALTEACMTYDRAKLTADVLQLMAAGPKEVEQGYTSYADTIGYPQTMTPRPAPQTTKSSYITTSTAIPLSGATISATSHN